MDTDVRTLSHAAASGVECLEVEYRPALRMPAHAHAELSLTLITRGAVRESVLTQQEQADIWTVGIKPPGVEHANEFGPRPVAMVSVRIDPGWLLAREDPAPVLPWRWLRGGDAASIMLEIRDALRRRRPSALWVESAAVDLLAALSGDPRGPLTAPAPAWLNRVRQKCIEEAARGVQTAALSAEAGMHPVALARAFRRHFGESISECIRRARAQRALHLLTHTDLPLAAVAAAVGCTDQSHLTRLLRAETGRTPGWLRRGHGFDRSRHAFQSEHTLAS